MLGKRGGGDGHDDEDADTEDHGPAKETSEYRSAEPSGGEWRGEKPAGGNQRADSEDD